MPDLVVRPSDLYEHDIVEVEGRRLLRLTNGTANRGEGSLYVYGVPPEPDGVPHDPDGIPERQLIVQRVFYEDFSFIDIEAGFFIYHSEHKHIHVQDWSRYRLRQVVDGDQVGSVVAEGDKISSCLIDGAVDDSSLPYFSEFPRFISCGTQVQGISVGWVDVYTRNLPGQQIDITDVPDGDYWLESEVDPLDQFLELNEDNNVTRIRITIGSPPGFPDRYEPNDTVEHVATLRVGAVGSANLGPCNPERRIEQLSLHDGDDIDTFRFYINTTARADNVVLLEISAPDDEEAVNTEGIVLELLGADGPVPREPRHSNGIVELSLEGIERGWYSLRISSIDGAARERYTLTIIPPSNPPLMFEVTVPADGDTRRIHSTDLFTVEWQHSGNAEDAAWVNLFVNQARTLDGNEYFLATARLTPAEIGLAVINSAELQPGTYWVYGELTDGGTTQAVWSRGTVTFVELAEECLTTVGSANDCNANGLLDACEIESGVREDCDENAVVDDCDLTEVDVDANDDAILDRCQRPRFHRGDPTGDGDEDVSDAIFIFGFLFLGDAPPSCRESADVNNDGVVNLSDGIHVLGFLFWGQQPPAPPGPTQDPCGLDPDPLGSVGDLGCEAYAACD